MGSIVLVLAGITLRGQKIFDLLIQYQINIRYMNLSKIKEKYKEILEESEEEKSDDQWEIAYSRMKNRRRRHVLTESNCVNHPSKQLMDEQVVLKLKEKLAQCVTNINRKDKQISELKHTIANNQQKMNEYTQQIQQLKQVLSTQEQRIIENKVAYGCMEKDYSSLTRTIESQNLNKELMKKQFEYFQEELNAFKQKLANKDSKIQEATNQIRNYEKYKAINSKLKIDNARLRELLAETDKYRIFANQAQNKHYLGRPSREHECWFPDDLVLQTENYIKKQHITSPNHNFKQMTLSLVKFINKHIEEQKKKIEKKAKKVLSSRIKEVERKHNHSMHFVEIRGDSLKKSTIKSSICKSRKTNILNQSKKCTQSFIYDRLEKSLVNHEVNQSRDLCVQMLGSFRKGMVELLSSKKLQTKKIMKLIDWMIEGMLSIFPKQKNIIDIPIGSDQIKISQ